ncbi:hypothetical protein ACFRCW_22960 [Streptomyces sp. NPDC056653]|uniref:hypothetical protein n=1 Tax=Streptomyces sp. NPDC056653 TaxID=3345894 RepID=UPI00369E445D
MGLTLKAMGSRERGGEPTLSALAASRTLALIVNDIQHALVHQARNHGLSRAAIGEMLHVTRQAAFSALRQGRGRPRRCGGCGRAAARCSR